jgi:vancomycin resistance protein YoaR
VSPDIYGSPGQGGGPGPFAAPPGDSARQGALPPPAPDVEPWPLKGPTLRERFEVPAPPESVFTPPVTPAPPVLTPEREHSRHGRRVLVVSLIAVVLLAVAYLVPAGMMTGKVLPGTTVAGVDLGGLTPREAADRLRERLGGQADADIAVKVGSRRFTVSPAKAGLAFDVDGTVALLPTGFPGPADLWRAFVSQRAIEPKILIDATKLTKQVSRIAAESDRPVYQGQVVFKGLAPVVSPPKAGQTLDQGAAAATIESAYLDFSTPVELATQVDKPVVTDDALRKTLPGARQAVQAPITLTNGSRTARIPAEVIAANLTFAPDSAGVIKPLFDARTAIEGVQKDLLDPATAPRDATFGIVKGRPALIPGRPGKGVDTDRLADSVGAAIAAGGNRTIAVSLTTTRPTLDDAEARTLGIKEKIGEYSTTYPCCAPRVTNIHAIADLLNGYIVKPGETFSINDVVGQRDQARGFVEAPTIQGGRLVSSIGGGISQFATTMFNAVFFAGLKDVRHTPHDFYNSLYPLGRDAMVSYPDPDYRWKNDSKFGVMVQTAYTGTTVTVALWSTKRYDQIKAETSERRDITPFGNDTASGSDCLAMPGEPGFTVTVTRVFYQGGEVIKQDHPVTTVYRPQPRLTCAGNVQGATTDTAATAAAAPAVSSFLTEWDQKDTVVPVAG